MIENTKRKKSLRLLVIFLVSVMLVASLSSLVFAEEAGDTAAADTDAAARDEEIVIEEDERGFKLADILLVPIGFIFRVCYNISDNYAIALLLFAIIMQVILLPLGIKQQKNMVKQASLRPKESAIRKKYAGRDDAVTKKKCNDEIMALYQQENFNPAGGCLPLLLQLPIIFALFAVVRQPLTYINRLPSSLITVLKEQIKGLGTALTAGYEEISVISYLKENGAGALRGLSSHINADVIAEMPDFKIFGGKFDLSVLPKDQLWSLYLIVPVLTFVFMILSSKITRKLTYRSETTEDAQSAASMKIMEYLSPLMCTYFAFIVPSAIGIYWMYRNILAIVQQFMLSKICPYPRFTEEELKAAEREYLGKTKPQKSKQERDPNRPRPKSLHSIDFDDDDVPSDHAEKKTDAKPKSEALEAAPLKEDRRENDGE